MLVRNLSNIPLNLRKAGRKFILLPGKATVIPDVLFTKDQVKAIYGKYVQVLNDDLKVIDTPSKEVAAKAGKTAPAADEAPVEVIEEVVEEVPAVEDGEVLDNVEETSEVVTLEIEEIPVVEVPVEEAPAVETFTEEDKEDAELEAVIEDANQPKKPAGRGRGGRKSTKKDAE